MSKFEKLIKRIKNLDNNMRFEEVRKVMEVYEYEMKGPSSGSSHMTFRKKGYPPITIPQHSPIKRVYIEIIKEMIEESEVEKNGEE